MKAGILGYGNLGRGVEAAINKNEDMELVAVYTRRDPAGLKICTPGASVKHIDALADGKEDIDVLIICGGSATDLPEMTPKYAALYNVVDSFDTHANVLAEPSLRAFDPSGRQGLYILGNRREPGTF